MRQLLLLTTALSLAACADSDPASSTPHDGTAADVGSDHDTGRDAGIDTGDATNDTDASDDSGAEVGRDPAGRCDYTNPFSGSAECKQYDGAAWDAASALADCDSLPSRGETSFVEAARCELADTLGTCTVGDFDADGHTLVLGGSDAGQCAIALAACETFAAGEFAPSEVCADSGPVEPPPRQTSGFVQPYLDCREPLPGEPEGASDGDVCTRVLISACTEEGRRFDDYAACSDVLTQRPYYGAPTVPEQDPDDPRLADGEYMEELAWVTEQVEACACVCCHSSESAPSGASGWHIEAGSLWIDSVPDSGLAMLAGLVDSSAFGAYAPEDNNGFARDRTGLPTTDPDRMRTFLVAEYLRRGNALEDADSYPPFGGPLYTQSVYEPRACVPGDGFDAEGRITWPAGAARYVYVLEAGSANPGVPPNRDLPDGTLWRVDVEGGGAAMRPGITYGVVPTGGAFQRFPFEAPPAPLQAGREYLVYVLADVGLPIVRCLSTFPG